MQSPTCARTWQPLDAPRRMLSTVYRSRPKGKHATSAGAIDRPGILCSICHRKYPTRCEESLGNQAERAAWFGTIPRTCSSLCQRRDCADPGWSVHSALSVSERAHGRIHAGTVIHTVYYEVGITVLVQGAVNCQPALQAVRNHSWRHGHRRT